MIFSIYLFFLIMIAAMMSKMQIVAIPRNAPVAVSTRSSFGKR